MLYYNKFAIIFVVLTCVYITITSARPINKGDTKTCSRTQARAVYDGILSGLVTFSQDKYGETTITGLFSKGFENSQTYFFTIKDSRGNVIRDLTKDLNVKYVDGGGTNYFKARLNDLNLNCTDQGILSTIPNKLVISNIIIEDISGDPLITKVAQANII